MLSIYLSYLILSILVLTIFSKMPKIYQMFLIVSIATVMASFNNIHYIKALIDSLITGKTSIIDFLSSILYLYLAAWNDWDQSLYTHLNLLSRDRIKAISGILVTFSIDILYLFVFGLIIYYIIICFKDVILYIFNYGMQKEREKELDFLILLFSLWLSFIFGYYFISLKGLITLFTKLFGIVNSLFT